MSATVLAAVGSLYCHDYLLRRRNLQAIPLTRDPERGAALPGIADTAAGQRKEV